MGVASTFECCPLTNKVPAEEHRKNYARCAHLFFDPAYPIIGASEQPSMFLAFTIPFTGAVSRHSYKENPQRCIYNFTKG